jgi:hypothetical protein
MHMPDGDNGNLHCTLLALPLPHAAPLQLLQYVAAKLHCIL